MALNQNITRQSNTTSYTWRPVSLADAPHVANLYQATDRADNTFWGGSLQEVIHDFEQPGFSPEKDTLAAFDEQGRLACLAWLMPVRVSPEMQFAFLWGATHPAYRRQGLGKQALAWLEHRGHQALVNSGSSAPAFLRGPVADHVPGQKALFENAGFTRARSTFRMRRGFDSPIAEPGLPPGLRLVEWQAGRPEAIHAALNEAFQDHWGHVDQTYEQFLQNTSGSNLFHPELSFLVMDNEEIAGVSLNLVLDYDNQRTGIQEGWIGSLCVRRPWRNQGVASALLNASMRAFAASGYTCAGLTVDTENLTGALRIYERLGFIRVITTHTYMKQI